MEYLNIDKIPNLYFSSDLHAFHDNIIKFCNRIDPITSELYENSIIMSEDIIKIWNNIVNPKDICIIAGDISLTDHNPTKAKINKVVDFFLSLNGIKTLVKGNHDHEKITKELLNHGIKTYDRLELNIKSNDKNQLYIIDHYPLLSWRGKEKGSIHLYGHVHNNLPVYDNKAIEIGWDVWNKPVNITEINDLILERTNNGNG